MLIKSVYTILFSLLIISLSAQYTLSGRVVNRSGEPLIGASVFLHSTQSATISDDTGEFVLESIEAGGYQLKSSYIGYKSYTEYIEISDNFEVEIILEGSPFQVSEIEIIASELEYKSPFTFTDLDKEEIDLKDLGQDLPYLLEHSPSVVVTSDAGAGIGYTGMRVRGSDPTRINVTINGVPLNDSESHGVFWVNLPDFANSVEDIQLQRGAGPSTNGAGAFGATIGLNTQKITQNPYINFKGSYGSFNTQKLTGSIGTGLINNRFTIDGRYSVINSDGYIDRGRSKLSSYYFSAAEIGENHSLRLNVISGNEITYQSWNGVPEAKLFGTQEELLTHYFNNSNEDYNTVQDSINLFESGRNYNAYTYDNQVDDYEQDHYQLLYALRASDNFKVNATAHYTKGRGYFETFRNRDKLANYGIDNIITADSTIISRSNLIRRKWLDNNFYGLILNADIRLSDDANVVIGSGYNIYDGDHFGRVIFVEGVSDTELDPTRDYYFSQSTKKDHNTYAKLNYDINGSLKLFADIQYRKLDYVANGTDDDLTEFTIDADYNFLNPKFGLSYSLSDASVVYGSYALAQREPVRSDFIDARGTDIPSPEQLHDVELGYRTQVGQLSLESNIYYMLYKDQLVLTGAVNNVGSPIRVNVDNSYRVGLELSAKYRITDQLIWKPNLTISRNKIREFQEFISYFDPVTFDFDFFDIIDHSDTDISFSPNIIGGSNLMYIIRDGLYVNLLSKYVGKQFLDNTSSDLRKIDPYIVNDIQISYSFRSDYIQDITAKFLVNNFLDTKYVANGYTYSYGVSDLITENYLYPQAGINFLLGIEVTF